MPLLLGSKPVRSVSGISTYCQFFCAYSIVVLLTTREWRVITNVKKCAVVVCNEDKVNPGTFICKWGEDELPIVDRYTYLGVDISK